MRSLMFVLHIYFLLRWRDKQEEAVNDISVLAWEWRWTVEDLSWLLSRDDYFEMISFNDLIFQRYRSALLSLQRIMCLFKSALLFSPHLSAQLVSFIRANWTAWHTIHHIYLISYISTPPWQISEKISETCWICATGSNGSVCVCVCVRLILFFMYDMQRPCLLLFCCYGCRFVFVLLYISVPLTTFKLNNKSPTHQNKSLFFP